MHKPKKIEKVIILNINLFLCTYCIAATISFPVTGRVKNCVAKEVYIEKKCSVVVHVHCSTHHPAV